MSVNLHNLFLTVARDKKIKDADKWVEDRLAHCQVDSGYSENIHLKCSKRMRFGVQDASFYCEPFIAYRECINNDKAEFKEFEVFTFSSIEDSVFRKLVEECFHSYYDSVKDFRLYYLSQPVEFTVMSKGVPCVLGEFNDLDLGFEIYSNLYDVRFSIGDEQFHHYFNSDVIMKTQLMKTVGVENVSVIYNGKSLKYSLSVEDGEVQAEVETVEEAEK